MSLKGFFAACIWIFAIYADEMTPQQALERLLEGNERYSQGKLLHLDQDEKKRLSLVGEQKPFAIILGCSDSRVSPEIIFDQGIGDLFVVRVAGNVVGPIELNSIEYSALHLRSSILLVLGHQNCGAIQAVIHGKTQDVEAIAPLLTPACELAKTQSGSLIENSVKNHVLYTVEELKHTPALASLIDQGKLQVVGGYYDFQTGMVAILTPFLDSSP